MLAPTGVVAALSSIDLAVAAWPVLHSCLVGAYPLVVNSGLLQGSKARGRSEASIFLGSPSGGAPGRRPGDGAAGSTKGDDGSAEQQGEQPLPKASSAPGRLVRHLHICEVRACSGTYAAVLPCTAPTSCALGPPL